MLIWLCALHCEAKPVIDYYHLHKSASHTGFDLYHSKDIACVVSGMGDLNMATALGWAASRFINSAPCWINLGVAGHQSLEKGSLVIADRVSRQDNPHSIYPAPLLKHPFLTGHIISQSQEQTNYHPTALFDMEAYAFVNGCSRFTALELCSCVKIISDNAENPPVRDKRAISELIAQHMPNISEYASCLQQFANDYYQQFLSPLELERFLQLAHFTRSQQIQMSKILLGLRAFDSSLNEYYQIAQQAANSRTMIAQLQGLLNQHYES